MTSSTLFGLLVVINFIGITAILAFMERNRFGTWLTPVTVTAAPIAFAFLLATLVGGVSGYIPVSAYAVGLWTAGIAVFGTIGFFMCLPQSGRLKVTVLHASRRLQFSERRAMRLCVILGWLVLVLLTAAGLRLIRSVGVQAAFGPDEILPVSMGRGFVGHLGILRAPLIIVLFGTAQRIFSWRTLLALLLTLTALAYSPKYHAIQPVVAAVFYRVLTRRTRISLTLAAVVAACGILLFFISYLIVFEVRNPGSVTRLETYRVLMQHLVYYLIGGVLAMGETLKSGQTVAQPEGVMTVFAPFVNLVNQILHFREELVTTPVIRWYLVNPELGRVTNVTTVMGTLWINLGTLGALLYVAGLAIVAYGSYIVMLARRHVWLVTLCTYLLTLLAFSWFGFYFGLLPAVEIPVICLLLFLCDEFIVALRRSLASRLRQPSAQQSPTPMNS